MSSVLQSVFCATAAIFTFPEVCASCWALETAHECANLLLCKTQCHNVVEEVTI